VELGLEGKLDKFAEILKTIHKSVEGESVKFKAELSRVNHVTPTIYLELLDTYKRVLKEKRDQSSFQISRLQNGLDKLSEANKAVEEMQKELTKMQPELEKASLETEKLMEKLTIDKAEAEEVQKVVSIE
jgi:dynein heavy chain